MNNIMNSKEFQMKTVSGELEGLRKIFEWLADGDQEAANALIFMKSQYATWPKMVLWLKTSELRGKRLVEFFQNESPDGGGYHMGIEFLDSRIKGHKHNIAGIKVDELL